MQDFFEEVSRLVESESQVVLSIMDTAAERKRSKQIEKLSETDAESLYNMIEKEIETSN